MAMSGCSACAAGSAPRRLNSSCTEKTRCTVGRFVAAFSARATSTITAQPARSSTDVPAMRSSASVDHLRPVDDRRADIDAGGAHLLGAGEAGVDVELGIGQRPGISPPASSRDGSCWR